MWTRIARERRKPNKKLRGIAQNSTTTKNEVEKQHTAAVRKNGSETNHGEAASRRNTDEKFGGAVPDMNIRHHSVNHRDQIKHEQ